MSIASWTWLSLIFTSAVAREIEVLQFPGHYKVDIAENSSTVLRFHITATNLSNTAIMYGVNGTNRKYYPVTSFDYTSLHSAIVAQCNINTTYYCSELFLRVEGKPQINNTSFHLVLTEMEPPNIFRQLDLGKNFTVYTTAATSDNPATSELTTQDYKLQTTTSAPLTTSSDHPTPCATLFPGNNIDDTSGSKDNSQLIFIFALLVVTTALILSGSVNILLCCFTKKPRRSSASHKSDTSDV